MSVSSDCGFWYIISMLHPDFCLTCRLLPFRGMLRFHHVHLLLPSFNLVWYVTLVMIIGLSCIIILWLNYWLLLSKFPCVHPSLLRIVDLIECFFTWMLTLLNSFLVWVFLCHRYMFELMSYSCFSLFLFIMSILFCLCLLAPRLED